MDDSMALSFGSTWERRSEGENGHMTIVRDSHMVTAQEIFTAITLLIWSSQTLMTLVAGAASAALGAWSCCSICSAPVPKAGSSACPAALTHLQAATASPHAPGGPLCQYPFSINSRPVAWAEHTTSEGLQLGQKKPSWSLCSHPMLGNSYGGMSAFQSLKEVSSNLPPAHRYEVISLRHLLTAASSLGKQSCFT